MKNELIIYNAPKSGMSEAIRTLRTNLQFTNVDSKLKTILLTSSVPGEGKSFISSNLAAAIADSGKKVLLVDCDIRRGRIHKIFKNHNKKGLSNLLIEDVKDVYKKYINKTEFENLDLIFKGTTPPNPSELLSSEKNKKLINILKNEYDYIIFDGSPIGGLPDSLVMSTLVDGVLLVCSYKETTYKLLEDTKKKLQNVNANILGVIVNRYENKKNKYYEDYYE